MVIALLVLTTGLTPTIVARAGRSASPLAIGPNNAQSTTLVWTAAGPYGGHVLSMAIAPSDPDVIYAGTKGGLYRTIDAGETWTKTTLPSIPVNVIQVVAGDADLVYVGTDDGIYRSADGGVTWTRRGFAGARIRALAVHPDDPDVLLAGSARNPDSSGDDDVMGVFKSVDAGQSWQPKQTAGILDVEVLLIDANTPAIIYAAVTKTSEGLVTLFRSTDGGETWAGEMGGSETAALAMTPAGHHPAVVYAVRDRKGYRSTDQGATWTEMEIPFVSPAGATFAVDPTSPNTVYLGTLWYQGDVVRSLDGGETWEAKAAGLVGELPSSLAIDPRDGTIYAGLSDGGVFKSSNLGEQWHPASEGMISTYIAGLAVDPSSTENLFSAVAGHPLATTTDGGATWSYPPEAPYDVGAVTVDPSNPSTVWAGEGFRRAYSFYVHKSIDGGRSWRQIQFLRVSPYNATGVTDIIVSPADSQCVFVGTSYRVANGIDGIGLLTRTTDGGDTWTEVSGPTTALALDPNDSNLLYLGKARTGQVLLIRYPCRYAPSQDITPEGGIGDVRDIAVGSASEVYVAASDGLWRRAGVSWTKLSGLPTDDVTALAIDRRATGDVVLVGTGGAGIFASSDAGVTWQALNEGLGHLAITELTIVDGPTKTLYAGMAHGGVWRADLGGDVGDEDEGMSEPSVCLPLMLSAR